MEIFLIIFREDNIKMTHLGIYYSLLNTTGGAKFYTKDLPQGRKHYKTEMYFTQTITGIKNC